ncbi:hypothetical protein [Pedobacter roseus]|uniref:Uncharacterized protein n=1 Tax=Pedobacter roseus TaxID=336820 RepID=A0A7G9QK56_9SPHI|nr:hypothetical protein [Pedobacter roseus]QNN43731.1 hypothetical protein H9L23_06475 [Pedobacter roseus]
MPVPDSLPENSGSDNNTLAPQTFLCGHHKVYLMYNKRTTGKFIMGLKSDYEIETPEEM